MIQLADTAGAAGLCGKDSQEIAIDSNLGPTVEREVVIHELLHAIWSQTFLDDKYPDQEANSKGEAIIDELSPRLLDLIRSNPKLVTYLTS